MGSEAASPNAPTVFRTAFGYAWVTFACFQTIFVLAAFTWAAGFGWPSVLYQTLTVFLVVLAVFLMLTTSYRVWDNVLELRSGPFRRRIPIALITSLSEYGVKRGRIYGLGTDIVAVEYDGGTVGITPKDTTGLATALGVPLIRLGDGKVPS